MSLKISLPKVCVAPGTLPGEMRMRGMRWMDGWMDEVEMVGSDLAGHHCPSHPTPSSPSLSLALILSTYTQQLTVPPSPQIDWSDTETDASSGKIKHLWEESWDDDDTSDDFAAQLRYNRTSPSSSSSFASPRPQIPRLEKSLQGRSRPPYPDFVQDSYRDPTTGRTFTMRPWIFKNHHFNDNPWLRSDRDYRCSGAGEKDDVETSTGDGGVGGIGSIASDTGNGMKPLTGGTSKGLLLLLPLRSILNMADVTKMTNFRD